MMTYYAPEDVDDIYLKAGHLDSIRLLVTIYDHNGGIVKPQETFYQSAVTGAPQALPYQDAYDYSYTVTEDDYKYCGALTFEFVAAGTIAESQEEVFSEPYDITVFLPWYAMGVDLKGINYSDPNGLMAG